MDNAETTNRLAELLARSQAHRLSRRTTLSLLAGLGLTALPAAIALATPRGRLTARLAQGDATPEAPLQEVDAPPATPELGEQPDVTGTWHVQVGSMSHEEMIDAMAFLPWEININVGDSIFFEFFGVHTATFPGDQ